MRDEVDAGRRIGIDADSRRVHAFASPQVQEVAAERIVAQPRDVRGARTESRRGDGAIRRVAAESLHVFDAGAPRLVELDHRFAQSNQIEALATHRFAFSAANPAAYCAATARTASGAAPGW